MVKFALSVLFTGLVVMSCGKKDNSKNFSSPKGYDLLDPVIIHLRTDLDEISGIQYYPKDTSIFAINDELGFLYKIFVRKKIVIKSYRFSAEADYEDVVMLDSTFYTLKSNGDITTVKIISGKPTQTEDFNINLQGKNEFETLYLDQELRKLMLICKDCTGDSKKEISVYSFDPLDLSYSKEPAYVIDAAAIKDELGNKSQKFKPSAAAIHPISKEIYIVSAVAGALVIADKEGSIKGVHKLNPAFFKQPEGLTFTPNGDLLISNESAEIGAGNILIFKYKPLVNEKG